MANLKKCMKKICAVSLAALMLGGSAVTVLPEVAQSGILVSAASEGTTDDGLVWEENEDGGVTITKYTGEGGSIVIPVEIDGKPVTEIGGDTFSGCTGLTSVMIPDGVTYIGEGAFYGCTGLTSVMIPDGVTYIGEGAFGNCTRLTSVTIPDSVIEIGDHAFSGCTRLTSVTIPDSVIEIGDYAFSGCTGLTSINVSADNVYYSSDNGVLLDKEQKELICCPAGFKGSYTIPNSVSSIGRYVFYGCTGLTDVTIPGSVTEIGDCAFYDCTGLASVTIPDSVTELGDSAFEDCTGLTSVTIPDSVTQIGWDAFRGCTGLTGVTIPDSVTSIGDCAFWHCTGLTSVMIPDGVTYIGEGAFDNCTRLTSINVSADNVYYSSDNGVLLDKEQKELICCPAGFKGSYTIPDSVTLINEFAFEYCTGLTSVTIPDSVTEIGEYAFYGCKGLTSITIPDSVTSIGEDAFSGCTGLTSITIPDGVTSIDSSAFVGCTGLTKVTIPDSVTEIGEYAFYGCTGLTSITIGKGVTSIDGSAFSGCTGLTSINVSADNEYFSSDNGVLLDKGKGEVILCPEGFKGSYTIPNSVTEIGYTAFEDCTGLTSINVSADNVYYSSDNGVLLDKEQKELICCPAGFKGSYEIPDSVTEICMYAFYGCTGLTSVTIPDSVTDIGWSAFEDCTGLTSVTIPDSVTEIEDSAFEDCTGLTDVTIPDSITQIGWGAFTGCTGLTSVTIPDSVTLIDWYAFYSCAGLTGVTIPDSVTYIGDEAFSGCTGLTSVTIPDSVTSIGNEAFGYYWDDNTGEHLLTDLVIFGKVGSAAEEYANENGIPFVALDNELTDTKTNITVTGDIGENTKLEVSELKPEDVQISGKEACAYYDISLTENGEKIQPNGNVAVKIPYKGGDENIEVYRVNGDGTTEKMQSSYDGEYVTFITDHFSKYAIVADGGIEGDTNNDGEVNIADALMISRYDAGLADLDESQLAVSDVNSDGEVNIADALMISRFDAGLIDSL